MLEKSISISGLQRSERATSQGKSKHRARSSLLFFFCDFLFLICSFLLVNYWRIKLILPDVIYVKLFLLFIGAWTVATIISKKYPLRNNLGLLGLWYTIVVRNALLLLVASVIIVFEQLYAFSRGQLFGTVALMSFFEFLLAVLYAQPQKTKAGIVPVRFSELAGGFSLFLFMHNFLYLVLAYLLIILVKHKTLLITSTSEQLFLLIVGMWIIVSFATNKFRKINNDSFIYICAPYLKAFIFSILLISVVVFYFRFFFFSRLQLYGTFTTLFAIEMLSTYLIVMAYIKEPVQKRSQTAYYVPKVLSQTIEKIKGTAQPVMQQAGVRSAQTLFHLSPELDRFEQLIRSCAPLGAIDIAETAIVNATEPLKLSRNHNNSLQLLVNTHKINDVKRINRFFLAAHDAMGHGGYFCGYAQTNERIRLKMRSKYGTILADYVYFLHFFFHRVAPKIPYVKRLYFAITRGRNRAISKAELLGRLYFCGFEIAGEMNREDELFFVAKKVAEPSTITNPSYGPLIRLRRVGMNKEIITIYKFRTMHPYSEFLQEYVYQKNKVDESGKFKDDFRTTGWGKIFRKFWIDELPQVINYVKGDIAIFGVRALSLHYFSLYPEDLQALRTEFKPGLIPPYYADMPANFEEILASEKRYLLSKKKNMIKTDIIYLHRAITNIFLKKARSK